MMMMRQQLTRLQSVSYFTIILFSIALFLTPSVLTAQTCTGNATSVVSQTGVNNPTNALGVANAAAAELWDTGDQIVLDLGNVLNSGSTIVVTWRGNTSSTADPIVIVETSSNGTTFTAVAGSPFTLARTAAYFTNNITASSATRYVRFTTTNVYNVDLDALTFTNQTCSPLCGVNTAGIVWRDFDSDGVKDSNEAEGVAGVTVKAFDCNGNLAETATTDSKGEYTFTTLTPSTTNKYRIEFSNITAPYEASFKGTSGLTDVQFISSASCNVDFAVNNPVDYCQPNPSLMINCYVSGAYSSSSGTGHTLVGLPYDYTQDPDGNTNGTTATGNPGTGTYNPAIYTPARPTPLAIADHNEIGSTWGLAYDRNNKNLFAAAYVKAGTSLGPTNESTGKIYKINAPLSTSTVTSYVDLNTVFGAGTAGTNPHPIASTSFNALDDAPTNAVIGKVGLGDLAISNDNSFLYTVNLADRKLYKIPTSGTLNSTTITRFNIPTTGLPTVTNALGAAGTCPSGDVRPFGIGVHPDGSIYVGGVCSAESLSSGYNAEPNNASYQLTAYVWKFDGTAFTLVLNESLRFDRDGGNGYATGDNFATGSPRQSDWEPWHNLNNAAIYNTQNPAQNEPMLADISFDEKGDMFIGMRDRLGDCVTLNGGFLSNGDIYKACKTSTTWAFEQNATCGGITTAGANNNQGPAGGEFIHADTQGDGLPNSGTGGVFNLMGKYQVLSTATDAVYLNSAGASFFNPSAGGVQVFGTQDGSLKGAFNLYEINDINTFAKAAGVGAISAICDPAPLQIGNYVWIDTDKDGVQDPCEGPLSNVTLSLWKSGVQIATTTTDANGNYAFTGIGAPNETWTATSGTDSILPNMAYEVRISTTQTGIVTPNYSLTTANGTTNNGNDQNDSDAALVGTDAVIAVTTGAAGSTNHTLDFGFTSAVCEISLITNVSGCYDSNGNTAGGSSVATIQAIVDWSNNPSGETINVTCTGATAQSINPATASKPAILNFEVPANGSAVTITSTFSTSTTCTATQNVTAPTGTCLQTPCVAGNTGGTVWRDFNNDGIKDATETSGVSDVTITAYDCNGNVAATTTTDALGQYTFTTLTPSATNKYRIEFSGLPTQYKPTFSGTNGRTDVQFISAASCNVHFGLNNPVDYCSGNPFIAVNCYQTGNQVTGPNSNGDVLVAFANNAGGLTAPGNTPSPTHLAVANQIGGTFGLAYHNATKTLLAASYYKYRSGFGPAGQDAIYSLQAGVDNQFGTADDAVATFLELDNYFGPNSTGTDFFGAFPINGDSTMTTKASFGDIDLSPNADTLYAMNLFDRKLYGIPVSGTPLVPTASAANIKVSPMFPSDADCGGTIRPFAVHVTRSGKVYVGATCEADSWQLYVWGYNPSTNMWDATPSLKTKLLDAGSYCCSGHWNNNNYTVGWIMTGLEIDDNGDLVMGMRLRETDAGLERNRGDIIKACKNGTGGWTTEFNGMCGGMSGTGVGNGQGSGGSGEFFDDSSVDGADVSIMGGLTVVPGSGKVIATFDDPFRVYTGGIAWFDVATGQKSNLYEVGVFPVIDISVIDGKQNVLGEMTVLCDPAPLQVGNYVWIDTDKDGVQDPCEGSLSNVALSLWKNGVQIATTTTDANGNYAFTGIGAPNETWTATSGTDSILPNMAYEVRISTTQTGITTPNYILTTANSTASSGNDQNDSDAALVGTNAVIAFTTGAAGSTNHTLDFGFKPAPLCNAPTLTSVATQIATCTNGIANSDAKVAVRGIVGMASYAYGTNGMAGLFAVNATASTIDSIQLTGLANPSVATTYTFRIWGIDTTCYNDTTVVLNPKNCLVVKTCTGNAPANNNFELGTTTNPEPFAGGIKYKLGNGDATSWDTATQKGNEFRVLSPMAASGNYFVYIYSKGTTATGDDACLQQLSITVQPNTKYILCAYAADAKADGKPSGLALEVQEKNAGGGNSVPFHYKENILPDNPNWRNDSLSLIPWTLHTYVFTTGSTTRKMDLWLSASAINGDTSFVALDFACLQVAPLPTIASIGVDVATCTNGVANSDAKVAVRGIAGMAKYAYGTNGTTGLFAATATASTADSIKLTGLANPSIAKTYTFRIYATDTTCYNDTTVTLTPSVCPSCSITATFMQGACNNNGTTAISTDDYFTVAVSNVTSTNGGTSGKYEVVLNGTTVLNTGGTTYGTPVTVGTTTTFLSNGATTYNLTVRDLDQPTCVTTVFTTVVSTSCSVIPCPPTICLPVTVTRN